MNRISVTVLTKNSEAYIERCLKALSLFDEVILLDNGSTDQTIAIAERFPNVNVKKHEFIGFGPMKNLAAEHTRNDWVLTVDSDEILSEALVNEVLTESLDPSVVYRISRLSHYRGRLLKGCGWYPDFVPRLYNKRTTGYYQNLVHEGIIVKKGIRTQKLNNSMLHYPYDSVEELINKMQHYSSLFAQANKGKKSSSPIKALLLAFFAFIKSYFLRRGIFCGYEGLVVSINNANGVFYKYMKLHESNRA